MTHTCWTTKSSNPSDAGALWPDRLIRPVLVAFQVGLRRLLSYSYLLRPLNSGIRNKNYPEQGQREPKQWMFFWYTWKMNWSPISRGKTHDVFHLARLWKNNVVETRVYSLEPLWHSPAARSGTFTSLHPTHSRILKCGVLFTGKSVFKLPPPHPLE